MNNALSSSDNKPFVPAADAPPWFVDNIQQPGESRYVAVGGGKVHFLTWNWTDTTLPTLVFVHGFSGHARWWSFLMPFFTHHYRIAAIDLPGMGDSSALAAYDDDCFARGILGVMADQGVEQATIIGHSFGGAQSMRAMAMEPQRFVRGIIVDSLVRFDNELKARLIDGKPAHRVRASRAECIASFRLMPPQPQVIQTLVDYVAHHSCEATAEGWEWKFDSKLRNFGEIWEPKLLAQIPVRVDCIYGTLSLFASGNLPQQVFESFPNRGELILVPDAYHHLMLDHPLELVAAIKQLLGR